jgi:hypothetical protein
MRRLLTFAALGVCLAAGPGRAAEEDAVLPHATRQPEASSVVRHDTLELPGLTACHQCEWRPKPHLQAAAEQCGTTPDGAPKIAEFECGFAPDCERVCNFVRCAD